MSYNRDELLKLPPKEKLELVEALWDSIDDELLIGKLSTEQMQELDKRLSDLDENPESLIPWEDVKKEMNKR
ncbi:addiction module protein [Ginsengibacter hankyongi]|uniref:Addiction module protein n=1 Tax=Ginsengibacter hankyongi TaxID=2607284 RepID=A0A5J5ILP8_9BACT|nr:addiction module protein [Ginsengibacter hankyongi]KAA9041651.1 addiction module protein [Ginsengibacter hankyongi]